MKRNKVFVWFFFLLFNVPWMCSVAQTDLAHPQGDVSNTTTTSRQDRSLKFNKKQLSNAIDSDDLDFRPSTLIDGQEVLGPMDDFGNEPWAPRPRITFEDDEYYEDEYEDEKENAREDDDESIRVAVWVDPSLKSGYNRMTNIMSGGFLPGSSKKKKPKGSGKPSQNSYGNSPNRNFLNILSTPAPPSGGQYGGQPQTTQQKLRLPNLLNLLPRGKGNSQPGQYGASPSTTPAPKLPKLPNLFQGSTGRPSLPKLPNLTTILPTRTTASSNYGAPTKTIRTTKKPTTRNKVRQRPAQNNNGIPSSPPDFVFGPPIREPSNRPPSKYNSPTVGSGYQSPNTFVTPAPANSYMGPTPDSFVTPGVFNSFQSPTLASTFVSSTPLNSYQEPVVGDVGLLTKLNSGNGVTQSYPPTPTNIPFLESGNQGSSFVTTPASFITDFGNSPGVLDLTGSSLQPDSYGSPIGQPLGSSNGGPPPSSIDQYGSPLGNVLGGEVPLPEYRAPANIFLPPPPAVPPSLFQTVSQIRPPVLSQPTVGPPLPTPAVATASSYGSPIGPIIGSSENLELSNDPESVVTSSMAHLITTRTPNFDDASLHEDSLRNHLHDPELTPNHPAKETNLPHDQIALEEGQQGNPFLNNQPNPLAPTPSTTHTGPTGSTTFDFTHTLYLEDVKKPLDGKEELHNDKNRFKPLGHKSKVRLKKQSSKLNGAAEELEQIRNAWYNYYRKLKRFKAKFTGEDRWSDKEDFEDEDDLEFLDPYTTNFGYGVFRNTPTETTTKRISTEPHPVAVTATTTHQPFPLDRVIQDDQPRPNSILDVLSHKNPPPVFTVSLPPVLMGHKNRPKMRPVSPETTLSFTTPTPSVPTTPIPTRPAQITPTVTTRRPFQDYSLVEYDFDQTADQDESGADEPAPEDGIQYIIDYEDIIPSRPSSLKKNLYKQILNYDRNQQNPYVVDLTRRKSHDRT